ncbi:NAD(P)-dependent oxidoreductase [Billgrantia endophytica]|uniref:3-hydroxyisobutyrate dehydrogenase n=1 Tax=Billgrantia endophytica TaxID=2033802 RepID=A0A2N7U2V1_9GAMM|nr:NAD(P)-dependent oxidoreductase [Halomonas endophytica]PMR74757.1 3-hydroxyisobutyrate dehydrogenase [Halomonas endophytica]
MSLSITVIGLGQMGGAMALTLQQAGFSVAGSDISADSRRRLADLGVPTTAPGDIVTSDVYLLSLPTSAQVREVIETSPGLLSLAPSGSVIVDTSTSDPAVSRELAAKVAAAGLKWLDAPVSGGPRGAASGTLGMLLGGDADTVEHLRPMLEAMSAKFTHVGGPGCGHTVKLANNYLCAAHLITTAEAVALAARGGVDPSACLAGLNSGSGRSAVSEVNFPEWVLSERFDSGFTMGLMRKDLGQAQAAAKALGLSLPLLAQVARAWQQSRDAIADGEDFNRIVTPVLQATTTEEPTP